MAQDFLIYDKRTKTYHADPEQLVRDDVEKHYWRNVVRTVLKDAAALKEENDGTI